MLSLSVFWCVCVCICPFISLYFSLSAADFTLATDTLIGERGNIWRSTDDEHLSCKLLKSNKKDVPKASITIGTAGQFGRTGGIIRSSSSSWERLSIVCLCVLCALLLLSHYCHCRCPCSSTANKCLPHRSNRGKGKKCPVSQVVCVHVASSFDQIT